MSIYSNVTEQDLINVRKLAEKQKNQRAIKIKNRILEKTHDKKLAESLSPLTKRLDSIENNKGEKIGDLIKKSESETPAIENNQTILQNSESQTPAIDNITTSQSLRDTLAYMKKSKNFFKLEQEGERVFWNKTPVIPQGENRVSIKGKEFDINPNIQNYFTKTYLTTKRMNNKDKSTVYDILKNTGFYSTHHLKGMNSARMQDALYNLPREIARIRNPPITAIESESDNLEGEGVKIIIPSNINDIYTRLEILLGLKLAGHSDILTEASNLIDELYKRGEIKDRNEYRNALDKFTTK